MQHTTFEPSSTHGHSAVLTERMYANDPDMLLVRRPSHDDIMHSLLPDETHMAGSLYSAERTVGYTASSTPMSRSQLDHSTAASLNSNQTPRPRMVSTVSDYGNTRIHEPWHSSSITGALKSTIADLDRGVSAGSYHRVALAGLNDSTMRAASAQRHVARIRSSPQK